MKRLGIVAMALAIAALPGIIHAEVAAPAPYFLPNAGTLPLVDRYNRAQRILYVAANVITDPEIAFALGRAKYRRVDVKVLLDEVQVRSNRFSVHADLRKGGIDVRVAKNVYDEFGIIDGQLVYVGSGLIHTDMKANPKFSNYVILTDTGLIRAYTREFLALFNTLASAP